MLYSDDRLFTLSSVTSPLYMNSVVVWHGAIVSDAVPYNDGSTRGPLYIGQRPCIVGSIIAIVPRVGPSASGVPGLA
jgi:hypothetical protein